MLIKEPHFHLWQSSSQPYKDCTISAGLIKWSDVAPLCDGIYLRLDRRPKEEEPTTICLRNDEALAIAHVLVGALWSDSMVLKDIPKIHKAREVIPMACKGKPKGMGKKQGPMMKPVKKSKPKKGAY